MDSKIAIVEIIAKSIQDYVLQEEKSFRQNKRRRKKNT